MHLVDTSAVIELIYGTEKGAEVRQKIHSEPIFLSSLTIHELLVGLKEKEVEALEQFFKEVSVLEFDSKAAFKSAMIEKALRQKGAMINKVDILIAGTCLVHNATLIGCDGGFTNIPELRSIII